MQDAQEKQPRRLRSRWGREPGKEVPVSEVYTKEPRVGRRTVIEEAKAAVPTVDLADRLCGPGQMRRIGEKWTARCPLPGHDERTASFTVYPGDRGWWCYGCQRGGDVVDLAQAAWGIDRADVAAAEVLMTFGHPIPERPPAWFHRQERQKPVRDAIGQARHDLLKRRLFRAYFMPLLARIQDVDEREAEYRILWETTDYLARMLLRDLASTKPGNEGRAS